MDTRGHESVAKDAGLPLLTEAFKAVGSSPHLNAFYMGNWLTDVSQLVDPVATASAVQAAKNFVDSLVKEIAATAFIKKANEYTQLHLDSKLEEIKNQLGGALDYYILANNDQRQSELDKIVRTGLRIKGYFKFAHPEAPGQDPGMTIDCFMAVFNAQYTQYYPYEHLDRPEVLPAKTPPEYVMDLDTGTRFTHESLKPDLYKYLRDDIVIAAGLLAEIDSQWARKTFDPGKRVDDSAKDWNIGLAKLGHALHAVEDFFAHSNFIEHASLLMGADFLPRSYQIFDNEIFLRRLKRYVPADYADWKKYPNEDYIVTGFFDPKDTLISLALLAEELIGIEAKDPTRLPADMQDAVKDALEHPEVPVFKAQKLIRNTLDLLDDPVGAIKDDDNEVAQKLKDKFSPDYIKFRRPGVSREVIDQVMREFPLFQDTDPQIKTDIINFVVQMDKAVVVGKYAISGYKAIKTILEFLADPLAWFLDFFSDKLKDYIKSTVIFYVKDRVYDYIGQKRIGCHSLLAKDHGEEWLYKHMKNCATGVHWYVVKTICRWSEKDIREKASAEDHRWVNWLELLEFFLRHPVSATTKTAKKTIPVDIIHTVVDGDSLASLAIKYRPTAVNPAAFTWETIADANFGTKDLPTRDRKNVVNQILRDRHWGYPVRMKPNYAFNPGLRVIIPEQKLDVIVAIPDPKEKKWFMEVMKHDWKVFPGYEDPTSRKSQPPLNPHTVLFFKDTNEQQQLLKDANKLAAQGRKAYRSQGAGN
jgi:hypothetical protein